MTKPVPQKLQNHKYPRKADTKSASSKANVQIQETAAKQRQA